jgi:cytochrome c oxidase subunit 2
MLHRAGAITALLTVAVLMSGCGKYFSSPQNIFAPKGEVASDQKRLFLLTMWPALAILILVEGVLLFILFRFRRKKGDAGLPAQTHGNNALEIGWTVAPMILLAFFIAPTIGGIVNLGRTPKNSMRVDVTAVQWAWQFSYANPNGGPPIAGNFGDPLHIPVDKTIDIQLHSDNVIHSFWVPSLAGKTDVIPGRANHMWIKGTDIGVYSGQCAEFCGRDHFNMRFSVVVESQADFDAWLSQQAAAQQGGSPALAFQGGGDGE